MNTPISFKLAKRLKEKGFDKICSNFYTNPRCKMFGIDEHGRYYRIKNKAKKLWISGHAAALDSKHVYYAPTISEVVMWLYEKHGVWIWAEKYENESKFVPQIPKADLQKVLGFYKSPTEAYEAAIEYILDNLI